MIAHALNNPLQTIKNCLYLANPALPSEATLRLYLATVDSEVQRRLAGVAWYMRELYPISSDHPWELCTMASLLSEVRAERVSQWQVSRVTWVPMVPAPEYVVRASPGRLKQVFANLATNAFEAMQPIGV